MNSNNLIEKNECKECIYDTTGFCEWYSPENKKTVKQTLYKCKKCGNGKASEPKEVL